MVRVWLWALNVVSVQVLIFALAMTWAFNDFAVVSGEIEGEVRDGVEPRVCVGWYPQGDDFQTWSADCPAGFAAFGNGNVAGYPKAGSMGVQVSLYCCPLPAADILTEEHLYTGDASCPPDYVITGGTGINCGEHCVVRCTRINTERYRLGKEDPSLFYRERSLLRNLVASGRGSAELVAWQDIPASLRLGLGRTAVSIWDADGCVGYPYGSLLTTRASSMCGGFKYRQLQYPDGIPVKMLQDCAALDGGISSEPSCVKNF